MILMAKWNSTKLPKAAVLTKSRINRKATVRDRIEEFSTTQPLIRNSKNALPGSDSLATGPADIR
jgi:hypothetical protein